MGLRFHLAWWYQPEYIINELNINSVITTPGHEDVLPINSWTTQRPYTLRGYAYSGGGKKVTRVEVTMDGGESWKLCVLDLPEKPSRYGKHWCWCFWSLEVEVLDLAGAKEIAVRAWDESPNTQPEKLIWNVMGMMNNCWFRVKTNVCRPHKGEIGINFDHPTQPGNQSGGWMAREKHLKRSAGGNQTLVIISPSERYRRIIENWEKGQLVGRGSFGSVYEAIVGDGFFIAIKEVSLLDQGAMGRQSILCLEQEIALLSQFEHENIVQYYGTAKDDSNLYIFLELMAKGSLANLYQTYNLKDSQVSAYTRQILSGLKYLHDCNVVHRDIKCANILVEANGMVKLADFGLAKATKLNDVKSCKGTAFWMAPEVVNAKNHGYGLPADIWSLGCTVLEMLTGQVPYSPLDCMQALFRIGRGELPPLPDSLSRDASDFILQCLQVIPDGRPTAAQLLDHPFVKRPVTA